MPDDQSSKPARVDRWCTATKGLPGFSGSGKRATPQQDLLPFPPHADPEGLAAKLARREMQVFKLTALGYRNAQIAEALFMAPKTATAHRTRILEKMRWADTKDIIQYAWRCGFVR